MNRKINPLRNRSTGPGAGRWNSLREKLNCLYDAFGKVWTVNGSTPNDYLCWTVRSIDRRAHSVRPGASVSAPLVVNDQPEPEVRQQDLLGISQPAN